MASRTVRYAAPGPYRASDIREGEPYELSNGHRIECMSGGTRHGLGQQAGGLAIGSDPGAQATAMDVGLEWGEARHLRAPDLVVGDLKMEPGWEKGLPQLAVEYADRCQDEAQLQQKIQELRERGLPFLWVVRLVGPLRVEVYEPGKPMQLVGEDGELRAPGVLRNPVPVRALVDQRAAMEVALRNLLNRKGYQDLDAVLHAGYSRGHADGEALGAARGELLAILKVRGLALSDELAARVRGCADPAVLERWAARAYTATTLDEIFSDG